MGRMSGLRSGAQQVVFICHSGAGFPLPTRFKRRGNVNFLRGFEYVGISISPAHWSDRASAKRAMFSTNATGWIVK